MKGNDWLLLGTETTGTTPPMFVVAIAAQRMRGWERMGEPFRRLLNQNRDVPPLDHARFHQTVHAFRPVRSG